MIARPSNGSAPLRRASGHLRRGKIVDRKLMLPSPDRAGRDCIAPGMMRIERDRRSNSREAPVLPDRASAWPRVGGVRIAHIVSVEPASAESGPGDSDPVIDRAAAERDADRYSQRKSERAD
jgi:hypothetical protein